MAPIPRIDSRPTAQPDLSAGFDAEAIRSHVGMLHGLAAGVDGVLVVSTYYANPTGESDAPGSVTHHRVGDIEGMVESILAHADVPNANVFTGLQVMRRGLGRGKRGAEADIVAMLGLVVDLDADTGKAGSMPIEPNMVLETSTGNYQPFVLFDRALSAAEVKPLAAALKRATGSDHGTADIAHVWRIPGTLNWPNAKKLARGRSPDPVAVSVDLPWDGSLTSIDDLRTALEPWAAVPAVASAVSLGALPSIDGIDISPVAAELLAANDVGDRSAWASKVVEQLAFDGLTAEEACAVFLAATGDWVRRYDEKDATKDFERLWSKFGAHHAEERAASAVLSADFVAKNSARSVPVAANDNAPPPVPSRNLPAVPPMHPDPFATHAAGGLLEEISRWITSTAIIPVPELSLTAAIALIGGMFGDRALGPTRSGLNMYLTTVMGVASGKGHAPKSIVQLATTAGKAGAVTNGDPTSSAAIERMLRKNSSTVVVLDEFGLMLQDVNSRRANSASASIRKFLLTVYDQSDSVFYGRQYASAESKPDDSPIMGPALTVLGMTTPTTLYEGLSEDSLTDGMLSRFVFTEGKGPATISAPRLNREVKLPRALKASLERALKEFPKGDNPLGINKVTIPFDRGEEGDAYRLWAEIFLWQNDRAWSDREHYVNGRAAENTVRLASIRAVSRDPASPIVTIDDVAWGWAIVHRSIQIVTEGVDRHMAGSTNEALRKAVTRALEKAADRTLPWSYLLQREGVSAARGDEVAEALQWLVDTGKVVELSGKAKPGPRCRFQLVA